MRVEIARLEKDYTTIGHVTTMTAPSRSRLGAKRRDRRARQTQEIDAAADAREHRRHVQRWHDACASVARVPSLTRRHVLYTNTLTSRDQRILQMFEKSAANPRDFSHAHGCVMFIYFNVIYAMYGCNYSII